MILVNTVWFSNKDEAIAYAAFWGRHNMLTNFIQDGNSFAVETYC
jgi:hypothetical protein